MQKLVFTNGGGQTIDLTSGNFGITNWEGLSGVGLNIQTQQVPFQDGGVFLDALMEQREISVTVAIQDNNNLSARYERKRQLISALNPKLGEGILVYTNDYLSRQIKAVPQLPIFENKNSNDAGTLKASVVFSCCSPYWEDLEDIVVSIQGTEIVTNNGDVPCQIKANLFSNIKTPILFNERNQKQIMLNDVQGSTININTNNGEKSIEEIEVSKQIEWIMGGEIYDCCCLQNTNLYGYSSLMREDILTGKTNILNKEISIRSFTYSKKKDLIVAVGWGGIITSQDGINWIKQISTHSLEYVIYIEQLNLFVTVGAHDGRGIILTSEDGINWTTRLLLNTNDGFQGVAYSEDLNMAIVVGKTNAHYTSSDCIIWAETVDTLGSLECIKYVKDFNSFITTGYKGGYGCIYKSEDGVNWETIVSNRAIGTIFSYEYSSSTGLSVAACGNYKIIASYNLNEWSEISIPFVPYSIRYSEITNEMIAVGSRGGIAKSLNGIDWTMKKEVLSSANSVTYSKKLGLFVTVGPRGAGKVMTSTDSYNWITRWTPSEENQEGFYKIIYSEYKELFVAVGWTPMGTYGVILTSTDGITWTEQILETVNILYGVTYSREKDLFVAVGGDGEIVTSTDGINWTKRTSQIQNDLHSVCYSEYRNIFVATGINTILISEDGIEWDSQTVDDNNYESVLYSESRKIFVVVGKYNNTGNIYTSTDGINWTKRFQGLLKIVDITSSVQQGNFLAIGDGNDGGYYITSYNGKDWVVTTLPVGYSLTGICNSEELGLYVVTGAMMLRMLDTEANVIKNISPNSDMTFNLEKGQNKITFYGGSESFCILSYRQKYIGV